MAIEDVGKLEWATGGLPSRDGVADRVQDSGYCPKGLFYKGGGGGAGFTLGNRSYGHSLAEQCWVCLTGGSHQARTSLPAFRHKNKLGSIWEGFL